MKGTKELVKTGGAAGLSPFDELEMWFEDVWARPTSLFGALWPEAGLTEIRGISPSVDIYEEGHEMVVKADIPGVSKDDIKVEVVGTTLTISGEKRKEEKIERDKYYRYERSHGSFCRAFELPEGTDTDKMKAHFEAGVLEVRIPMPEATNDKAKNIPIR